MNSPPPQHRNPISTESIKRRYAQVGFRGSLMPREGDANLGRLRLDEDTAVSLGSNNVGLFVENLPSLQRFVDHLRNLKNCPDSKWIVVASSKQVATSLRQLWEAANERESDWSVTSDNVTIVTPEDLKKQRGALACEEIAAILVVDFACHIHKCRGFSNRGFQAPHDRPQIIVDFRNSLRVGDWSPPLLFFTNRRAVSVNTLPMLSPYCLEAFRYIDGRTIRFGEIQTPGETHTQLADQQLMATA